MVSIPPPSRRKGDGDAHVTVYMPPNYSFSAQCTFVNPGALVDVPLEVYIRCNGKEHFVGVMLARGYGSTHTLSGGPPMCRVTSHSPPLELFGSPAVPLRADLVLRTNRELMAYYPRGCTGPLWTAPLVFENVPVIRKATGPSKRPIVDPVYYMPQNDIDLTGPHPKAMLLLEEDLRRFGPRRSTQTGDIQFPP